MYQIDETRMLRAAKESLSSSVPTPSIFKEGMIFLLVSYICMMPQSIVMSIYTVIAMLTDPAYYEMILSPDLDASAITDYSVNLINNIPNWMYAATIASSGFMILGAIIYCKAFQKRSPFTLGFNKRGCAKEYLVGALVGLIMITLPALACYITGCVTFEFNSDFNPLMIALFFGAFLLQGMGEEALFRGYLMTSIARRYNVWMAIIMSAVTFAIFHVGNPNFTAIAFINITLFGIFAGVLMFKRGSIWAVGAIHSVWNFAQSNLLGFNVSGNPKSDTVLSSQSESFGSILSGGDFGLEGGLGVTVVLLAAILVSLLMPTKQSEKCKPQSVEQPNAHDEQ